MAKYLLGVDSGTTGVKAKIYDLSGRVMAEGYREYGCKYPKPGWVEQNVHMLLDSLYEALAEAVSKGKNVGVDPDEIASIGLSTQRNTHMYIDKDGNVLRDGWAISWQDGRSTEEAAWMNTFADKYFQITGLPVSTAWASSTIKWMLSNEPDVIEKTAKIITTQEYFLHEMGAEDDWFQDWSNASQFGMFDIQKMEISNELVSMWGIRRDMFPTIVGSGWKVGSINKRTAERTGLKEGMPICTGGGDQQCAGIGAGVLREGQCEVTFGTAGVILAALNSPKYDPNRKVCLSAHAFPEKTWEAEGLQSAAASCYRWFRDNMASMIRLVEPFTGIDPYEVLNAHAAKAPVGSNGIIFTPYLAGSSCPNYNNLARGAFLGLTFNSDFGSLARAVMEGVTMEARTILEAFNGFVDIKEVMMSGGATKSDLWCQIQADIYGRPTTSLLEGECTVLGAAMLGGYGAGVFNNMQEAADSLINKVKTYEPNPKNVKIYNELYDIFKTAYNALDQSNFYESITSFQETYA